MRILRAAILALALSLAACAPATRATLVLWHSLDGPRERALLRLIDEWNAGNTSGAFVVPERRANAAQHVAVLRAIGEGRMPGLILASPQQAAAYQQREALVALDAFVDGPEGFKPNDKADLFPFVQQAGRTPQGAWIGVPLGGEARVMLANKQWLDERNLLVPETWEVFDKVCERAGDPAESVACFGSVADDAWLQEWLIAHGTRVTGSSGALQLSSGEVRNALQPVDALRQRGLALSAISDVQLREEFAFGRMVFAFDWSRNLRQLDALAVARGGFEWSLAPLPTVGGVPASLQRAPLLVIPKTSAIVEQRAWSFVRWMLDTKQTAQWAMDTGELPARISSLSLIDGERVPNGFLTLVQRIGAHTQAEPLIASWPCARDAMADSAREIFATTDLTATLSEAQSVAGEQFASDCPVR